MAESDGEVRNDVGPLDGTRTNVDGTAVEEVVQDDKLVVEVSTDADLLGEPKPNADGTPVLVVTPT